MGLLAALLGKTNGFSQFADNNSNLLGALGAGIAQGPTFSAGLANAAQMVPQAKIADQNAATALQSKNTTYQFLKAKYPDLAAAVDSGVPVQTAWTAALQRDAQAAKPAGFTLSPGQVRYDAGGRQIAEGAPSQAGRPSYGQTPIILTDPNDKMHMGQMSSGGGLLVDGQTYPSLPDGWKVGTVSQSGSGGLSDQALDIISSQYLAGDKSAIQGFARNATMRSQIANAVASKANAMGMDGKAVAAEISSYGGNVAAQRAAGTRAAQVGMAASEADQMADIALDASKAVPRGAFMPWNAAENLVRTGTSSPEMASFVTATTSLVNAYARAVSPLGAPTDAMRAHAEQMLNTAQSPEAYAAVIAQMKQEMTAALNAPVEISKQLKSSITGKDIPPTLAADSTKTINGVTYTRDANGDWYQQ